MANYTTKKKAKPPRPTRIISKPRRKRGKHPSHNSVEAKQKQAQKLIEDIVRWASDADCDQGVVDRTRAAMKMMEEEEENNNGHHTTNYGR